MAYSRDAFIRETEERDQKETRERQQRYQRATLEKYYRERREILTIGKIWRYGIWPIID